MTSAPLGMLAELTHSCPLHCAYCSNPATLVPRTGELSTADWLRVFSEAAALGVAQVHLSGGEPLQRRDLPELATALRAHGI
jgi:pyrroloquinoline quinone biosynthesis protein E